jgi:hypothetical protein
MRSFLSIGLGTGVGLESSTIDTSIAADERANADPVAPKEKASIAGAGAAFLASLKPEQRDAPLGGLLEDGEGGDIAEEGAGSETAAEAITRADGSTWKPELGRWVDARGRTYRGDAGIAKALVAAGGVWKPIGWLIQVPPISLLAAVGYRLVAKYRDKLPGGTPACKVPQK